MASEKLMGSIIFLLSLICFQTPSTFSLSVKEPADPQPFITIFNEIQAKNPATVQIQIKANGFLRGSTELTQGHNYQIQADIENGIYYATAVYGLKFVGFDAYNPTRDMGHVAIYWRIDDWGFSISHDKASWKKVAPWETE